jgi:hypothetical protein
LKVEIVFTPEIPNEESAAPVDLLYAKILVVPFPSSPMIRFDPFISPHPTPLLDAEPAEADTVPDVPNVVTAAPSAVIFMAPMEYDDPYVPE